LLAEKPVITTGIFSTKHGVGVFRPLQIEKRVHVFIPKVHADGMAWLSFLDFE